MRTFSSWSLLSHFSKTEMDTQAGELVQHLSAKKMRKSRRGRQPGPLPKPRAAAGQPPHTADPGTNMVVPLCLSLSILVHCAFPSARTGR